MNNRILVPSSDFFQDKDTFILIVQDSGTLGIKLAVCIQLYGTKFILFCESANLHKDFDLVVCL